jgi:hypothetical protein
MSAIKKHIAWFLVFLFGYLITPAGLIHELHGHDDTHCTPGKTASIEIQHVHCKILQIEAQVFTTPASVVLLSLPRILDMQQTLQQEIPSCATMLYADLRAPPAV